jgi:mono/diheme cytochrome c family protein
MPCRREPIAAKSVVPTTIAAAVRTAFRRITQSILPRPVSNKDVDWKEIMSRSSRSPLRLATAATTIGTVLFLACAPLAMAQDDVAAGQRIWKNKAGCPQCHGWAGDGLASGFHHQGGLPLRKTQLTRDQIRMTIQCGRPGTEMPHFDRFAYTDKRCYGMTDKELGSKVPDRADTTLQPSEIDAVAEYVATKVKGAGPVTRAQCVAFFGNTEAECAKYPER